MENSQLVTQWLDNCQETICLIRTPTIEAQDQVHERILSGRDLDLYNACLADGWTMAELDAAYTRRTGFKVDRKAQ